MSTMVDVSESRQSDVALQLRQEELLYLSRMNLIGEVATGIAHELNQPLQAIANYAQGCRRRMKPGDAVTTEMLDVADEIARLAESAGQIVHRFNQFTHKRSRQFSVVEINEVVHSAVLLAKSKLKDVDIQVDLDLAKSLPRVEVDVVQIEQVLLNLLWNAVDAVQQAVEEPQITIATRLADSSHIEVSVIDNGPGIPTEQLDRLFTPFETTKKNGMGMGLAICRSILETHNSNITGHNTTQGAVFHFTLAPMHGA